MPDDAPMTEITEDLLRRWSLPDAGGDKNSKGRLLVVGGSAQTPGAVLLAVEAALRVGAGKVQIATAGSAAAGLATAVPEAYVQALPEGDDGALSPEAADIIADMADGMDAVLLGPGMTGADSSAALLERVVPGLSTTVVIDATATAFLTKHPDGLGHLAGQVVLTPNLTELAATLGLDGDVGRRPGGRNRTPGPSQRSGRHERHREHLHRAASG